MKKNQIKVGGVYRALVNGKVVPCRVDAIREVPQHRGYTFGNPNKKDQIVYDVTNLTTGRKTTFRSAMKFREEVQAPTEPRKAKMVSVVYCPKCRCYDTDGRNCDHCNGPLEPRKIPADQPMPTTPQRDESERAFNEADLASQREEGLSVDAKEDEQRAPFAPTATTSPRTDAPTAPTSPTSSRAVAAASSASTTALPASSPSAGNGDSPLASILRRAINGGNDKAPHLIVEARAGTGKTTTLVTALQVLKGIRPVITPSPQQQAVWDAVAMSRDARSVCFVAFNKSIAEELQRRVPAGCDACTMHSMGYRAVRRAFGGVQASEWAVKDIIAEVTGTDLKVLRKEKLVMLNATERLVSLCKQNLIGGKQDWIEELDRLASHYDVDLDKNRAEVFQLVPQVLDRCRQPKGKISFDDMIWLPVVHGLPVYTYDLLLIDERQDLNKCQMQLALMGGKRIVAVGDRAQSIYGFAGADANACENFATMLEAHGTRGVTSIPLTVTRRCGKAIVAEANRYVADFEAHEDNPIGRVDSARYPGKRKSQNGDAVEVPWEQSYGPMVRGGDMVLCRCNAPLVSQCFAFIRRGVKANIQGRDIGQGLISTIKKMNAPTVPALVAALGDWHAREVAKEEAKRHPSANRVSALDDRLECLLCFTEGTESVEGVVAKIEAIFTDDKSSTGVRLSSIHKAKGLEARRVFILRPPGVGPREDKMRGWELEQEDNLRYVACTRAIEELTYVS